LECSLQGKKAGQRQSIKIGNRSFENVAKFKYLTDQNCIHEEIKINKKIKINPWR
jgi:hypothetical protein